MTTTKSIRVFLIGAVLTFLMAVIPHSGLIQQRFSQTLAIPKLLPVDVLEKVKPALKNIQNNFKLQNQAFPAAYAGSDYENASAYGVVDLGTGNVIASKNLSKKLPMASLTKIMTAVVALDLANPEELFTVSQKAAAQEPTKVMLKAGEHYKLLNLLKFALMSSANDSSQTIKEGIDNKLGGNSFIEAMNYKAGVLGLKNTHFTNAEGYDNPNHYSSVEDLTILANYAVTNYPLISQIVSEQSEDLTGGVDFRFYINNWNGLLGVYPGASGVKIGNTGNAGYCTIVQAEREGKKLLAVVMGAPGVLERDLWASELLDLGFNKIAELPPVNISKSQLKQKYASWVYY